MNLKLLKRIFMSLESIDPSFRLSKVVFGILTRFPLIEIEFCLR